MTTILRFILFFLLAPVFAVVTQAAGAVQDDFRIVNTGLQAESIILNGISSKICNYDSSGALLHQRKSIDGEDDLNGHEEFGFIGAAQPLLSFLAKFVATKNAPTPKVPGKGPDFVVTPEGTAHRIPSGATGPTSTRAPGVQYIGGSGGNGLDPKVTGVRFMEQTAHHPERVIYMNKTGQTVSPSSGQTIPKNHPDAHIPANP